MSAGGRGVSRRTVAARRVVRGRLAMGYLVAGDAGAVWAWPITVGLRWSDADPHSVECVFPSGDADVRWLISRDLLVEGCARPVGIGDVSVLPDPFWPGWAELVLSTDSGRACMRFPVADLAAFLDRLDEPESGADQRCELGGR